MPVSQHNETSSIVKALCIFEPNKRGKFLSNRQNVIKIKFLGFTSVLGLCLFKSKSLM